MESPILKQIAKFLQDKKKYKRWLAVFVCLAVVVGFATTAALKMRGKAMTHDERVLNCKLQVHQHAETCYDQEKNIICGYADYVVHKHNDDCYDPHNGNLVCALPEVEAHQHTDECYQEQQALACGLEESEGHQHTEECRTKEQGELTCQAEEHTHTEECQAEDGAFSCGKEEHTHADECYQWTETLTCGQEESEGHHHTEACNQVQKTLVCQRPEIEVHTHGDECYQRVLITPEGEEIVQDPKDNTGVAQEVLAGTANKEVPEGRIEVRRSCGKLQAEEHTHTQENGCIEIREVLDGSDLRPVEEEPAETPEAPADGTAETPADGNENQEGNPENGQTPMDGTEEEQTIVKTFEGDGFKVIAEYKKDANIPEEAELKAEQITAEDDAEHYAEREAAFKENMEDENATMKALLKVGFYVNGEEVEPQTPVTLTVQLLGEDGLPEGTPMTIVHFANEGTKKLEGSKAENDTTSFEMESFSEIAIGYGEDDDTSGQFIEPQNEEKAPTEFYLKESFEQNKGEFKMVFTIKGNIPLPEGVTNLPTDEEGEDTVTGNESDTDSEEVGNADSETGNMPEEDGEGTEEKSPEEVEEESTAGTETEEDSLETDTTEDKQAVESGTEETGSGEELLDVEEDTEAASDSNSSESEGENPEAGGETEDATNSDNEAGNNPPADSEENKTEPGVDGNTTDDKGESSDADNTSSENGIAVNKLKFEVKELDEKSNKEIYKAIREHAEKKSSSGETFLVKAFDYSLSYMGQKLDLSECKVTAEITPTDKLNEVATENVLADSTNEAEDEEKNKSVEISITVSEISGRTEITDVAKVKTTTTASPKVLKTELDSKATMFAARANGIPNPTFRVQYYAFLDRVVLGEPVSKEGTAITDSGYSNKPIDNEYQNSIKKNMLPVFDTRGKSMPTNNGRVPKTTTIGVGSDGKVITETILTEVYAERTDFTYVTAPTLKYFNALVDNPHYKLKAIWVQDAKANKAQSIDPKDWVVYGEEKLDKIHFTNRDVTAEENEEFILIDEGKIIRLVYDPVQGERNSGATFYDYDISDGNPSVSNGVTTMNTGKAGINSMKNCNADQKYAFGNNNSKTDFGTVVWNQQKINMTNKYKVEGTTNATYAGCSFGLVSRADGNNVVFNVNAPSVFGSDDGTEGKHVYPGEEGKDYSLDFNRNGDTYTLSGVRGTKATGLEYFNHPQYICKKEGDKKDTLIDNQHVMTNNFWPMDGVHNDDKHFGETGTEWTVEGKNSAGNTEQLPVSDDGKEHNSYFGMYYEVAFELDAAYRGPLEYLFFGDDDMWVFLDDTTLVCDIGGVHSSVGEYVDLWDYLPKEGRHQHTEECYDENKELTCTLNKHTLKFFYTERGASGSSCWMHFTLPSVSSMEPELTEKDYGQLKVEKKVSVSNEKYTGFDADQDVFQFNIKLSNKHDDYRYAKYGKDADGKPTVEYGLVLWDGADFTLKNGEYIIVDYLPIGTTYTVTEYNDAHTSTGEVSHNEYSTDIKLKEPDISEEFQDKKKDLTDEKTVGGDIPEGMDEVLYINKFLVYELPKTGGKGTILYTMAGVAAILLGAGFMYRKKFREGRVGGSS